MSDYERKGQTKKKKKWVRRALEVEKRNELKGQTKKKKKWVRRALDCKRYK